MASVHGPGSRRAPTRCTLTGEPIRPDSLIYRVRETVRETRRRYLEADYDTVAPPLKLHQHAEAGVGLFGVGLKFTRGWAQYLDASLRDLGFRGGLEAAIWWDSEYGRVRVRAALGHSLPPEAVEKVMDAVLAIHTGSDPREVAVVYGVSLDWLDRKLAWCMRLAHRRAGQPVRRRRQYPQRRSA